MRHIETQAGILDSYWDKYRQFLITFLIAIDNWFKTILILNITFAIEMKSFVSDARNTKKLPIFFKKTALNEGC